MIPAAPHGGEAGTVCPPAGRSPSITPRTAWPAGGSVVMSKSPEPSAWTTLQLQVEQGVATVVLNRPDAANAMDLTMARELAALTTILERDPDLRAVLLTSRGKMFCAGGDLPSFQAAGDHIDRLIAQMTTHLHAAISNLTRLGHPQTGRE